MTITEAKKIWRQFYSKTNPTEEDRFVFTEALEFLIGETKDPDAMLDLGAMYYESKRFDLALKYYEMAAECGSLTAVSNLGYIWYYGRTGQKDYEKAFKYFSKAAEAGDLIAAYKVADMYKNGYFVEKDPAKYKAAIEDLYLKVGGGYGPDGKVKGVYGPNGPIPEIYTRLAAIRREEGKTDEALQLYDEARSFLTQRIEWHPFFGDLNIMKWLIEDVYELRDFEAEDMDLFDLYYLLAEPVKVRFKFDDETYEVESVRENGIPAIRFEEKWYRTADDFFNQAEIGGEKLTTLYDELYDYEVIEE